MDEILKLFGGADNIWNAIKTNAGKVGIEATRMMLELFYVLKSPNTGVVNKTLIVAALGYQLLPEDVMPRDKFGILGMLDNGVTLAFAYKKVKSSITPQVEQQVDNVLNNWFGGEIGNKKDKQNQSSFFDYKPSVIKDYAGEVIKKKNNQKNNGGFLSEDFDEYDVIID